MYRNSMAEMVRNDINKDKIAKKLGKTAKTIESKLNGDIDFTVSEAKVTIRLFLDKN